jgi:hypothetical protein
LIASTLEDVVSVWLKSEGDMKGGTLFSIVYYALYMPAFSGALCSL